ncbi:glycosyltransferase [Oceanospirillaceae bacterium ASx5O]|nr:glycosyltransferase [Oceanospirillaceae bacterium ASx5O]
MTIPDQLHRVTIVSETFAPEINGVANTLSHLVQGLRQRGIKVQLIRPAQTGERSGSGADALTDAIQRLPGLPIPGYASLRFGLPLGRRIRKALQQFRPQAVYVATEGPLGLAALQAARRCQLPVISGFHTNFHQYFAHYRLGFLTGLAWRYLRWFHNRTSATLVPTRQQAAQLQQAGFRNVQRLARGVNSELFHPSRRSEALRRQWGARPDDLVLLYVGRIAAEKNLQLALATWRRLRATDERVRLVLVGDGPALAAIRSQHPEVICCGSRRGEELAQHYASGDVFLFPSKTDTFGNVVTEAMASGLALVSFDYAAGQEHVRHLHNGMLAPFADEEAFIRCAGELAERPNLQQQMRAAARAEAETIRWDHIVDEFIQRLQGAAPGVKDHESEQNAARPKRAAVQ